MTKRLVRATEFGCLMVLAGVTGCGSGDFEESASDTGGQSSGGAGVGGAPSGGTSAGGSGGSVGGTGGGCESPPPSKTIDCGKAGASCTAVGVGGDPPQPFAGSFHGYADPSLFAAPGAKTLWLGYSWPHVVPGKAPDGSTVYMAAVENHLARSDDGGATFDFVQKLWPAVPMLDPEGTNQNGMISSETASIVAIQSESGTTWYGAHLRYFLQPKTGYEPNYATSWQVRIGKAATPAELTTAKETVLGVSQTAAVYGASVELDVLAGVPIQHCAMLNNPTLFAQNGTLYLIVECLAFVGTTLDFVNTTTRVFATEPSGAPTDWSWRYAGVLADHTVAAELGSDTIQQPDVSLASDGTPILVVTPAHADASVQVGTVGEGCVALEIESIDPPKLRRDCDGALITRAKMDGDTMGACTHHAASASGIMPHSTSAGPAGWRIHASGLRP